MEKNEVIINGKLYRLVEEEVNEEEEDYNNFLSDVHKCMTATNHKWAGYEDVNIDDIHKNIMGIAHGLYTHNTDFIGTGGIEIERINDEGEEFYEISYKKNIFISDLTKLSEYFNNNNYENKELL